MHICIHVHEHVRPYLWVLTFLWLLELNKQHPSYPLSHSSPLLVASSWWRVTGGTPHCSLWTHLLKLINFSYLFCFVLVNCIKFYYITLQLININSYYLKLFDEQTFSFINANIIGCIGFHLIFFIDFINHISYYSRYYLICCNYHYLLSHIFICFVDFECYTYHNSTISVSETSKTLSCIGNRRTIWYCIW